MAPHRKHNLSARKYDEYIDQIVAEWPILGTRKLAAKLGIPVHAVSNIVWEMSLAGDKPLKVPRKDFGFNFVNENVETGRL